MSNKIPFENFEDLHEGMSLALNYYKREVIAYAFIPKHLDIPDRPELRDFPRDILFADTFYFSYSDPEIRLALYEPDFSTFESKDGNKRLIYRNAHHGASQVRIIKEDGGIYWGVKMVNGVEIGISSGETLKILFLYLSLHQIHKGEAFVTMLGSEILNNFSQGCKKWGKQRPDSLSKSDRDEIKKYREKSKHEPKEFLPHLATSLCNFGYRLSNMGQKEEALEITQEAVNLCRELAKKNPKDFLHWFVFSLNTIGTILSRLGRQEEALKATQEAEEMEKLEGKPKRVYTDYRDEINRILVGDIGLIPGATLDKSRGEYQLPPVVSLGNDLILPVERTLKLN